jgi:hypothetical protein
MGKLNVVTMTEEKIRNLRAELLKRSKIFAIESDIQFSSWLISYGIAREVGTVNNELSRFIFDATTGAPIPAETLNAEVVQFNGKFGVRIYSTVSTSLEVRIKGFRALCHPSLSENNDGSFHQLVIFPEIVARIAALEGIELVVVQPWALNSIFGGFDPSLGYYATGFWELENNDSSLFASLVEQKRLAFLGTHDLIAHVSGLNGALWNPLAKNAEQVRLAIDTYIGKEVASIADLVLPYTAGVVLDDLAQPPSYLSSSHQIMLEALLGMMNVPRVKVKNALLLKYPSSFEKVIRLSRSISLTKEQAQAAVQELVSEIRYATTKVS